MISPETPVDFLTTILAFILAIPDMDAAVSGEDADPITTLFAASFGDTGAKFFYAVAMISFERRASSSSSPSRRATIASSPGWRLHGSR